MKSAVPPLHLITQDDILGRPDFLATALSVLRAGDGRLALHLRARQTTGATLYRLACQLCMPATGALLLINDRIDVALAADAQGVQIGRGGFDLPDARRLVGDRMLVGASVHSLTDGHAAARDGADFLVAGTLFETASHAGRPAAGLEWIRGLVDLGVPVIGIGGVTPDRVEAVRAAGATGVAVMRGIWDAASPVEATMAYLAALEKA